MGHSAALSLLAVALMYPGLGKLPLSPVPYDLPQPEYPHRLEITPTRPSTAVIPSVIFRPPSEILRNFGELQGAQPAPSAPRMEPRSAPGDSPSSAGFPQSPPGGQSPNAADPQLRPTRRQPLGW
jgi:hypothetical protein